MSDRMSMIFTVIYVMQCSLCEYKARNDKDAKAHFEKEHPGINPEGMFYLVRDRIDVKKDEA